MIVRKRLDISWTMLARATLRGAFGSTTGERESNESIQATFGDGVFSWPCLSVRTAFDATLAALDFPRGSEILVSAVTIPGMLRILGEHGLVAVPVEIDVRTTAASIVSAERALTSRTKAILAADLFGARNARGEIAAWAGAHGLISLADDAQAFDGPASYRSPDADVTYLSFGPIKTMTALSGAAALFRDPDLHARVAAATSAYPTRSDGAYAARTLRFAGVKALGYGSTSNAAAFLLQMIGKDPDRVASQIAQSFPGDEFFPRIRGRPSAALLATLAQRLKSFDERRIAARTAVGERLRERIGTDFVVPGSGADRMTYWTFPLLVGNPDATVHALRRRGFDATRRSSLVVVDTPPDRDPSAAASVRSWFDRMIFLPFDVDYSPAVFDRLADEVRRVAEPYIPADPATSVVPRFELLHSAAAPAK